MITSAFVSIWGQRIGAIVWDSSTGLGSFEYEPAFLRTGLELSPLKLPIQNAQRKVFRFPELRSSNSFKGMPGLLVDSLPDKYGNALINAWLVRHNRPSDSLNPVEKLCFIGQRGMGALEFEPALQRSEDSATPLELESLIQIAEDILSGRKSFAGKLPAKKEKALLDILKIGTSAGGARAKAVIAYHPKTNAVKSGQADAPPGFSHWLIKFDGVTDTQFGASSGYGRVEMAYYHMALDSGILMMESRVLEENGRAHFMTKRFDRINGKKLHVQSFCALQHYDFNEINSFGYEQLFETMRLLHLSYPQAEQLYRRMVFNVLGKNCDDHTKNFAFTMDAKGTWNLSPAFDLCHAYRPGSDWVSQHCLSINGKRKNITKQDLLHVAKQMNIKKAEAIIRQIAEVINAWPNYAKQVGLEKKLTSAIGKTLVVL